MAASLGKKIYLLLPKEYGRLWYWDNDYNNQNLWYPTIIKINQTEQGDWLNPIRELKQVLKKDYNIE